jgi:hypothetical protein
MDLVPTESVNRSGLTNNTVFGYLVPSASGSGAYTYESGYHKKGKIMDGSCTATPTAGQRFCRVVINVASVASANYYLRVKSIYIPSVMTVTATDASGTVGLTGAQAIIDSTGKANDVLRRVLVRVPLNSGLKGIPDFAIQTTDTLCKRLAVRSSSVLVNLSGVPGGVDTAPCQL